MDILTKASAVNAAKEYTDSLVEQDGDGSQALFNDGTYKSVPAGTVVVDSAMSDASTNPVQNKIIKSYIDNKEIAPKDCTFFDKIESNNKCKPDEIQWGKKIDSSGAIMNLSTYLLTGLIKVTDTYAVFGRTKTGLSWSSSSVRGYATYDSNKQFIARTEPASSVNYVDCTGAEYIRVYRSAYGSTHAEYPNEGFYVNFVSDLSTAQEYDAYSVSYTLDEDYLPEGPFESRVAELESDTAALENAMTENVTGYSYINTAVDRIVDSLKDESANGNIVTFGFNTDQHIRYNEEGHTDYTEGFFDTVMRGLKALSKISQKYPLDFICLGGDFSDPRTYDKTLETAEAKLASCVLTAKKILSQGVDIQTPLYDAWCPVIPLVGNHDAQDNRPDMTGEMFFGINFRRAVASGYLTITDTAHLNGYHDDMAHKIRYIFLDTNMGILNRASRETPLDYLKTVYGNMLSTAPADYKFIVLSHHPISNASEFGVLDENEEYQWSGNIALQSISAPYADRIICCICGHTHKDKSVVSGGILYISTTMAAWSQYAASGRTKFTENETAFDIFVVDQSAETIKAIRYGKGHETTRQWSYAQDNAE